MRIGGALIVLLGLGPLLPLVGQAVEERSPQLPLAISLKQIHRLNQVQILAAEEAMARTSDHTLFRYAERLWRDHRQGERVLRDLAQRLRIPLEPWPGQHRTLPAGPRSSGGSAPPGAGTVASQRRSIRDLSDLLSDLRSAPDAAFDRRYLAAMARSHREMVELMDGTLSHRHPPPVMRSAIIDLLPIVDQHRRLALVLSEGDAE